MASQPTSTVPSWVYKLPLPKTQKLVFESIFRNVDPATEETFHKLSNTREAMRNVLDVDSLQQSQTAIENYMPGFFGLMNAAEALPPDFSKWLRIIWSTPIGVRNSTNPFVYNSFRFEVVMCLMAYGIILRNQAQDTLQTATNSSIEEFDEKSKVVANLLTRAAGVFEHISQSELSQWKVKPEAPLPEACDETYLALASICLAEAEIVTIKKGLMKGTSAGALSKLCSDVFQKFEYASDLLKQMRVPQDLILPPFVNYIAINAILWKALTFRLLAEDSYSKGQYGNAVAYIQAASSLMIEKKDPNLSGFLTCYNAERDNIKQLETRYTSDNDLIYFEKVDPSIAVIPEPKCLVKTVAFQSPEPITINITLKKGTLECVIQ